MADYYTILKRAVAQSDEKSAEARRGVYEKARSALMRQLRSLDPPLGEAEITRQRLALEEAVRRVEAEAAETLVNDAASALGRASGDMPAKSADPAADKEPEKPRAAPSAKDAQKAPDAAPAKPVFVPPAPPPSVPPAPTGGAEAGKPPVLTNPVPPAMPKPVPPAMPPAAPMPPVIAAAPGARPDQAERPAGAPKASAAPAKPVFPPNRPGQKPASGAPAGQVEGPRGAAGPKPVASQMPGRVAAGGATRSAPRYGLAIAAVIALLALTGGGLAYWQRDALFNLLEPAANAPTQTALAPDAGEPEPEAESAPNAPAATEPKINDRILTDEPAPATEGAAPPAAAPDTATSTPAVPPPAESPPTAETETAARTPETGPAPGSPATPEPGAEANVPVVQSAMLYEETLGPDSQGEQFRGNVSWRVEEEGGDDGDDNSTLVIRGFVDVPDRNIKMLVTVRRNADESLPASHTIELLFEVPPDFEEGGVANVPGILMKTSEPTRGSPLVGASARVTNGYFLIGLSSTAADEQRNVELLRDRSWMDIPILYNNGRRAILTLEKGLPGEQAFTQAFSSWAS